MEPVNAVALHVVGTRQMEAKEHESELELDGEEVGVALEELFAIEVRFPH